MSDRGRVRASDEDRERLVAELHEHSVVGRLSTDDLEQRTHAAYSAQTLGELDGLRADLPATRDSLATSHRERRAQLTRRAIQETGGSLGLFLICTVVWLVSDQHHGQFWPVWVLLVVALSAIRNAWALYGPAPDLDAVEHQLNARQRRLKQRPDRRGRRRT